MPKKCCCVHRHKPNSYTENTNDNLSGELCVEISHYYVFTHIAVLDKNICQQNDPGKFYKEDSFYTILPHPVKNKAKTP